MSSKNNQISCVNNQTARHLEIGLEKIENLQSNPQVGFFWDFQSFVKTWDWIGKTTLFAKFFQSNLFIESICICYRFYSI